MLATKEVARKAVAAELIIDRIVQRRSGPGIVVGQSIIGKLFGRGQIADRAVAMDYSSQ
jgi:hypothetical protein